MAMISGREREQARDAVLRVDSLGRRVHGMCDPSLEDLAKEVRSLAIGIREDKVAELLSQVDVGALVRLRLGMVPEDVVAGRSIQDVLDAVSSGEIPGYSQEARTCRVVRDRLLEITPCLPDVEGRSSHDGKLIGDLFLMERLPEVLVVQKELERDVASVRAACVPLRGVTDFVGSIFMGAERRTEVLEALPRVLDALPGLEERASALGRSMGQLIETAAVGAWADYEDRVGHYNAEIARVAGSPLADAYPAPTPELALAMRCLEVEIDTIRARVNSLDVRDGPSLEDAIRNQVDAMRASRSREFLAELPASCLESGMVVDDPVERHALLVPYEGVSLLDLVDGLVLEQRPSDKVASVARRVFDAVVEDMPIDLDQSSRTEEEGLLVKNLLLYDRLRDIDDKRIALKGRCDLILKSCRGKIDGTGYAGSLFMDEGRRLSCKAHVRRVAEDVMNMADSVVEVETWLDDYPAGDKAWREYSLRAAHYNAILQRIVPGLAGVRSGEGVIREPVAMISGREREQAREAVLQADSLERRVRSMRGPSPKELAEEVRSLATDMREDNVAELLSRVDVGVLAQLRLGLAPEDGAVGRSIQDVLDAVSSGEINGSNQEARACRAVRNRLLETIPCLPDAVGRPVRDGKLLGDLYLLRRLPDLLVTQEKLERDVASVLAVCGPLRGVTDLIGSILMGSERRAEVLEALPRVLEALPKLEERVTVLSKSIGQLIEAAAVGAWADYERMPGQYNAEIARTAGSPLVDAFPTPTPELAVTMRQLDADAGSIRARVDGLDVPDKPSLEGIIRNLADVMRTNRSRDFLPGLPVSCLEPCMVANNPVERHARLAPYEGSSLLDLVGGPAPGQGPADEVVSMARKAFDAIIEGMPIELDQSSRTEAQGLMVKSLLLYDRLYDIDDKLIALRDRCDLALRSCRSMVDGSGYAGVLFMAEERRLSCEAHVHKTAEDVRDMAESVADIEMWLDCRPADDAVWREYGLRATHYDAILLRIVPDLAVDQSPRITADLARRGEEFSKRVREARSIIQALKLPTENEQKMRATSLVDDFRRESARELLKQVPVEALSPLGVRVGLARLVGESVGDVLVDSTERGQSPMPDDVRNAAQAVFKETLAVTPFEVDVDIRPASHGRVLRAVLGLEELPSIRREINEASAVLRQLMFRTELINEKGGYLGNLVMGKQHAQEVSNAVKYLESMLPDFEEHVRSIRTNVANFGGVANEADWERYRANRNALNLTIRTVSGSRCGIMPVCTYQLAKDALDLLERLKECEAKLDSISLPNPDEGYERIKTMVHELREQEARRRLYEIDVDVLSHGGARVGVLRNAGYSTLGDLIGVEPEKLARHRGITDFMGRQVAKAVEKIRRSAFKKTGVRIDVETKPTAHSLLVRDLHLEKLWNGIRDGVRDAKTLLLKSKSIPKEMKAAPGYVGNLTMTTERRELFEKEVLELRKVLEPLESSLDGIAERIRIAERATTSDAWEDFERNAASYYVTIESLGGGDPSRSVGDLPKELVDKVSSFPLDTSLMKSQLRSYQKFAAQYALAQQNALIGDEMGLGKTVEAIAAMAHLTSEGAKHFVVVCPLTVLMNWTREVSKHARLQSISVHGQRRQDAFYDWCKKGGVAVTTYETVSRLPWYWTIDEGIDMLVVDEAHYVKNPEAKRSQAVKSLTRRSKRSLFLTGTPLENNVHEMNNLVSFLDFDLYLHLKYDAVQNPIEYREAVAPVYLRRKRVDVLHELPRKIEKRDWCTLSKADLEDYRDALKQGNFSSMRRVSWRHDMTRCSAKAERLLEIYREAKANGSKVLVFSYFLDTLSKVSSIIKDDCAGVISGRVPASKRQAMIDEFSRSSKTVLVSQVTAGGVGLNIQAANIVVFCEPQLKPSTEEQAISRSFRMGQVRTVVVHRLLMDKTVDERIESLLSEKRRAFMSYADESVIGRESLGVIDTIAILKIIEEERARYGITDGKTITTRSSSSDKQ